MVATGAQTFFGQTTKLVQSSKPNPHIDRILNRVVVMLMSLVFVLIIITLIILGVRGDDILEAIPLLLMVIITALPVALPAMFTVSMALGSQELSKKHVLVTRLNVLEDCALMSLMFSDKVRKTCNAACARDRMSVVYVFVHLPFSVCFCLCRPAL